MFVTLYLSVALVWEEPKDHFEMAKNLQKNIYILVSVSVSSKLMCYVKNYIAILKDIYLPLFSSVYFKLLNRFWLSF